MQTVLQVLYLGDLLADENVLMGYFWDHTLIQCTLKYFTSWSFEWKSSRTRSHFSPFISTGHGAEKTIKTYNARRKVEMRNPECVEVTWRREGNHWFWPLLLILHMMVFFQWLLSVLYILWLILHISWSIHFSIDILVAERHQNRDKMVEKAYQHLYVAFKSISITQTLKGGGLMIMCSLLSTVHPIHFP